MIRNIKIMLFTIFVVMVLFLIADGGGKFMSIFAFLIYPLMWLYSIPIIGICLFILSGVFTYALLIPKSNKNEKQIYVIILMISACGWAIADEYVGLMFLITCIIGVSYPIIQIIRYEVKHIHSVRKLFQ